MAKAWVSTVIAVCIGLLLVTFWQSAASAWQTPTLTNSQMTATVIIAGATQTQSARETLGPLPSSTYPTVRAFTPTDTPRQGVASDQMTTTAVIAGATQTQAAIEAIASLPSFTPTATGPLLTINQMTATGASIAATQTQAAVETLTALPSPSNNQMTATSVIARATHTQAAIETIAAGGQPGLPTPSHLQTPTTIATLTQSETEALRLRWVTELESAAGFEHPIFDYLVDRMVRIIPSQIYSQNYNRYRSDIPLADHEINPLATEVSTTQGTYIALIFSTSISSISWDYKDQFLIFRVVDGNPALLPDPVPYGMGFGFDFVEDPTPFADRNANGQLELALSNRISMGSSACYTNQTLALLEIQPDGSVQDITPITTGRFYISHLEDIDGDGIPEIAANASATNPYDTSKCSYRTIQWFGWNGTRYEDISATLDELFYPAIAEFWAALEEKGCMSIDDILYEMLWDEYARGNLQNVWDDLKADYSVCPADPLAFEQLDFWITRFLPG